MFIHISKRRLFAYIAFAFISGVLSMLVVVASLTGVFTLKHDSQLVVSVLALALTYFGVEQSKVLVERINIRQLSRTTLDKIRGKHHA